MRVHTTSVPATKYLPKRIHVKFTDDFNVPNNVRDRTFDDDSAENPNHLFAALEFLKHHNMSHVSIKPLGPTLTKRGVVFQIVEA